MHIEVLDNRVFLLHTKQMTYVMRIDEEGHLVQAYWGGRISRGADFLDPSPIMEPIPCPPEQFLREECSSFGNLRFKETSLKITFRDGTRDFRGQVTGYSVKENELTFTLEDEIYPVNILLHYRVYSDFNILEKWREVINTGNEPIELERCYSAEFTLPGVNYASINFSGHWGKEFGLRSVPVGPGKQIFESLHGTTAHSQNPFFALHQGADEEQGRIYFGILAWSGNFKIVVENVNDTYTSILTGISDTDALWTLAPGSRYETPHVYAGCCDGFGSMSRSLHRFAREHILPKHLARKPLPVLFNSWYATEFNVDVAQQKALADKAAKLGIELFVVDDGWFKGRRNSSAGLGDWVADPIKFPRGLGELISYVEALGMAFGLWVEPEMVNPDSDLYRAHPEWILCYPSRSPRLWRGQYMLNMANSQVVDYLFSVLDRLLTEQHISYLKWDMNRYVAEAGAFDQAPSEWKTLWRGITEGFYTLVRRLRAAHPNVEFEACASGGGRVDFGTMGLFDEFWPSDNTDPLDRLAIQEHYSLLYPVKCMRSWITDDTLNARNAPLQFTAHVAMCGVLGIGIDLNSASAKKLNELHKYVTQYKRYRETIQLGELYRLSSQNDSPLQIVQYQSEGQGIVFAFLRGGNYGKQFYSCKLRGLIPNVVYRCIWNGHTLERSGSYLSEVGLTIPLYGDYTSLIIEIEALS